MNINKVRAIAKKMHLDPGLLDKKELIRLIQEQEGNLPCFQTGQSFCNQHDCCWRSDCKPGESIAMA